MLFAIYLHSRLLKGWQGKQAAILGSCGFFVIWICYLGVNFLGKGRDFQIEIPVARSQSKQGGFDLKM